MAKTKKLGDAGAAVKAPRKPRVIAEGTITVNPKPTRGKKNAVAAEAALEQPIVKVAKFQSAVPPTQEQVEKQTAAELKRQAEVKKAGLPPAAKDNVPRVIHDGKNRTAYFVQKEARFEINPFSIPETIGAARWGDGSGIIDKLPDSVVVKVCEANGWPCVPLDRVAVKPLVAGLVEIAIRTDSTGEEPRRCVENQELRVARYKEKFAEIASKAAVRKERAKARPSNFGPRTATRWRYSPTKEILAKTFAGQQLAIFTWFVENKKKGGKGGEIKDIADGMRAAGFQEGKQPAEKVVSFYMNQWLNAKLVTREEVAE